MNSTYNGFRIVKGGFFERSFNFLESDGSNICLKDTEVKLRIFDGKELLFECTKENKCIEHKPDKSILIKIPPAVTECLDVKIYSYKLLLVKDKIETCELSGSIKVIIHEVDGGPA